ncbi:MAG: hypothetical protein J7500_15635 [Sphingomonas sp.]|uniref:carph-isopro domain-containing protein n=1 Tax=Sphingomonas sp. TaxID=28214 RepID=UPI001B13F475|nr:hypothetical protein [Sphingomonas sp.]MBO9624139.1 hypothetical protein [Sphingomonas sp.]
MSNHAELIRERGGIRPLARALGHKNHTTVQGWWERNNIPEEHLPSVVAIPPVPQRAEAA